jgi:hypothetical protein
MITWIPWNPVAMKNVDPQTESHIENGACQYSIAWSLVKYNPRRIVKANVAIPFFKFFFIIRLWDQVIDAPEDNKINVFKSGMLNGLNIFNPTGGHKDPISN